MVNINYHIATRQAKLNRSLYQGLLPHLVHRAVTPPRKLTLTVYAMSCERDLPEQVSSICSFLRHVGEPNHFFVVSDGSYSKKSIQMLRKINSCVEVVELADVMSKAIPDMVRAYAASSPMGKKLALEMSLLVTQPTMYVDSDVLFFAGAQEIATLIETKDEQSWYLRDLPGALDNRLLRDETESQHPVNGGFLMLKKPLDWSFALERLAGLAEPPGYFTEQTLLHLTMHYNKALPLNESKFVLQRNDQFLYQDLYANPSIALRHYVSTVRHKFWASFKNNL